MKRRRSIVVAYDPGIKYAGLVAVNVAGGTEKPPVVAIKSVASSRDDSAARRSLDSMRRLRLQARALLEFLDEHGARVLIGEVSDEGARSAAAAAGMAYARGMLAMVEEIRPSLPCVWVTPNDSRNAVVPEDERRAIREIAKGAVFKSGANAGKKKPGEMGRLLKEAVIEHVGRRYPGVLDPFESEADRQAVADALSIYEAGKGSHVVRLLAGERA